MTPQEKVSLWLPTNQPDYEDPRDPGDSTIEEHVSFTPVPAERRSLQRETHFQSKTPSPSPSTSIHSPGSSSNGKHTEEKNKTDDFEKLEADKKVNMMTELFGEKDICSEIIENEDNPMKTEERTTSASSKSVRFNDESMETVKDMTIID